MVEQFKKEIQKINEENEKKKVEEEERLIYEANIIKTYYGDEALNLIGRTTRPHPFIFTMYNIDDNETIEAVIGNPAYNRSPRIMLEIARKAEARRKEIEDVQ